MGVLWRLSNIGIRHSFIVLFACLCLTPFTLSANESTPIAVEDNIKAVYIFNFVRFTEWPSDLEISASEETNLSILGNLSLLKTLKGESFRQAAQDVILKTHACVMPSCIKKSHALFIDRTESSRLKKVLSLLGNRPVLTISDIPGFAEKGGMIELKRQKERVIFRINLEAIKRANLYVSAQLLQLAEIVEKKP